MFEPLNINNYAVFCDVAAANIFGGAVFYMYSVTFVLPWLSVCHCGNTIGEKQIFMCDSVWFQKNWTRYTVRDDLKYGFL